MNESPTKSLLSFSENYRSPLRCALAWIGLLALFCTGVLDYGASSRTFLYTVGVYVPLLLLIMLRRPSTPSRFDLFLIGSGFPLFFLVARIFLAWASKV